MNPSFRAFSLVLILLWYLPLTGNSRNVRTSLTEISLKEKPTEPKKSEFRAVWIATINNIDWPSKPNLPVEQQKNEFLKLLDTFQQFNLNVVILQVRAASDAFYKSKTEPWSQFLTGKQGRETIPYYDPLTWAIEMCHQRGMELHAWFNPFRVRNMGNYPLDRNSYAVRHPQYVKEYDKKLFLDPGYPDVVSHLVAVIAEVAQNYAVDAILLDDYFYPYPVEGKKFSDQNSFAKYGGHYFPKRLKDWRRENINHFISSLHDTLRKINPEIKFGISPFGIWRNKSVDPEGSSGIQGLSSYDDLYADVRKWLMKGWIDYVIPQLYWEKGNRFGDFTTLVKWWSDNSFGKSLYIGQALYRSNSGKSGWKQPYELNDQLNYLRTNEKVSGFAFYSASSIKDLSAQQSLALRDKQLSAMAGIHDDRHSKIDDAPIIKNIVPEPEEIAISEELINSDFRSTLEKNPISVRANLTIVSGPITFVKQSDGNRLLSWKIAGNSSSERFALVSFRKTGNKKYLQIIREISSTAEFTISEKKWKELKRMELLLVFRDIENKTDSFSDFFQMKRRKIKLMGNPFKPS